MEPAAVQVWDLPVRVCHWALAAAMALAWISARHDPVVHLWAGWTVAELTVFRIIWGFVGSRFARFSDLAHPPGRIVGHMRDIGHFHARRYLGHDPSGGALALVMLALLVVIGASGLNLPDLADRDAAWIRDVHKWSSNILLALVPFHILAVLIKGWMHRESLTWAMITGWKRLEPDDELPLAVRTAEQRLLDRVRAVEALALWGLLALAGAWLWTQPFAEMRRGAGARGPATAAVAIPAPAPVVAPATATAPPAAAQAPPAPAPVVAAAPQPPAPAITPAERALLLAEIKEAKEQALREVQSVREEARREMAARLQAAKEEAAKEIALRVQEAREQAVREYTRLAAANAPRVVSEPAPRSVGETAPAPASSAARPSVRESATEPQADAATLARLREVLAGNVESLPTAVLSSGGRLYDNWYAALGRAPPQGVHPSWPAGKPMASAADTWRCASCHGYDYRGEAAVRPAGQGGGTPAIVRSVRGAERLEGSRVVAVLGDERHRFTEDLLPADAKVRLALFLTRGQYTATRYFDPATGKARGVAARGKEMYLQSCATCHGTDGRGSAAVKIELGPMASKEPAQVFHKVRNGHPGAMSAALRPYALSTQVDVLTYIQTLGR